MARLRGIIDPGAANDQGSSQIRALSGRICCRDWLLEVHWLLIPNCLRLEPLFCLTVPEV